MIYTTAILFHSVTTSSFATYTRYPTQYFSGSLDMASKPEEDVDSKVKPVQDKEELAALSALEKEEKEFNKVRTTSFKLSSARLTPHRMPKSIVSSKPSSSMRKFTAPVLSVSMVPPSALPPPSPRAEGPALLIPFPSYSYAVLDLQPGVPESEIKITYRKKSLLIHPDKTSNPSAPAAFDKLKKAQTELSDEKSRARLDESIADARMLLMREHKLTVDSPEMHPDNMSEELRKAWRKKTVEVLIDNEHRRRKQVKAQMQEEGRELRKEEEEREERKRKREHEVQWEKTREERIGSWRDFQGKAGGKGEGKEGGGKKKKKLKVLG